MVGVVDGDTLRVMRLGQAVKIRISGIDAPERRQSFGKRAKQYASALVLEKTIFVRSLGRDRWGRILGRLRLPDGRGFGLEMIRSIFYSTPYEFPDLLVSKKSLMK